MTAGDGAFVATFIAYRPTHEHDLYYDRDCKNKILCKKHKNPLSVSGRLHQPFLCTAPSIKTHYLSLPLPYNKLWVIDVDSRDPDDWGIE